MIAYVSLRRLLFTIAFTAFAFLVAVPPTRSQDTLLIVRKQVDGKSVGGVYDLEGKVIVPHIYRFVTPINMNGWRLLECWHDTGRVVVDWSGAPVLERVENLIVPKRDTVGRMAVRIDGKWGFYDRGGRLVIPHIYDWDRGFRDGAALVSVGSDTMFIDPNGQRVAREVPAVSNVIEFGDQGSPDDTLIIRGTGFPDCRISPLNSRFGLWPRPDGIQLLAAEYDGYDGRIGSLFLFSKDRKRGAITMDGRVIIPFEYDEISATMPRP